MYDFKDHQKEEQKRAEKNRNEYLALKESGDLPKGIGSFEQFLEHKELEKAKEQANAKAEEDKVRELEKEKEKAKLKTKEITEKITTDEFDDRLAKTVEKSLDTSSTDEKLDKLYDVMNHIRWIGLSIASMFALTFIIPQCTGG